METTSYLYHDTLPDRHHFEGLAMGERKVEHAIKYLIEQSQADMYKGGLSHDVSNGENDAKE